MRTRFPERYGSWALVAGASEGLGAAFAKALARRGMNLVLAARRRELLEALAGDCGREFGVEARCVECDLGGPEGIAALANAAGGLDVGLVVYNAAYAPVGDFASMAGADVSRVVDVNVRGPSAVLGEFLPAMVGRGRGGFILMSSLAGNQGSPSIAAYAASKAFNTVLAEGLWRELRGRGVEVLACCAGAVRTPGYGLTAGREAPGAMDPSAVAEYALGAIGKGPVAVPGLVNRAASFFMRRILPRRAAIGVMALSARDLGPGARPGGGQ